jgi:hypothetical protein
MTKAKSNGTPEEQREFWNRQEQARKQSVEIARKVDAAKSKYLDRLRHKPGKSQ